LSNQEQRCRAFCKQEGLPVLEVFVDPGESGRSADRPEFQKMLAFCKKHQREIRSLVVQDLSRLARNLQDQIQTMSDLMRLGISVRSTYESNIDETAAGMLSANIFGTFQPVSLGCTFGKDARENPTGCCLRTLSMACTSRLYQLWREEWRKHQA
jgi:DNA invertase Pin-like site-specific DNA recombinase